MAGSESGAAGTGGRASQNGVPIWVGPLLAIIGVAMLAFAYLSAKTELRFGSEGVEVQATITGLRIDEADDDEESDHYLVRYAFVGSTGAGSYTGVGEVGLFRYTSLRIGDPIDVAYLAREPSENRLGTAEPQLFLSFAIGVFGALFVVLAPLLTVSTIWQRRRMARIGAASRAFGANAGVDLRRVDVFTRSVLQAAGGPVALIAGVAFLGLAAFGLSQASNMPSLLMLTLIGGAFGLILIVGGITGIRRGFGLRLAEVGPDGIWLPGLGRVGWADLGEARIEDGRPIHTAGEDADATPAMLARYARLGFVPRDQRLSAKRPDGLSHALAPSVMRFLGSLRPETGLRASTEQAPFGLAAHEMEQPFDDVIASVRRYMAVEDRRASPATPFRSPAAVAPPIADAPAEQPLTDAELRDLDARLGEPSPVSESFVDRS